MFSYYHHWWIVPVIATHAGAVAGAWIYYLAIEVNIIMIFIMTHCHAGGLIYYLAIEVNIIMIFTMILMIMIVMLVL